MFDFVRRHTKLIMGVLFLLIIPSFVLFGIEGYTRFNDGATKVATVNGQPVTQMEWDSAHRLEIDRLRQGNPNLDLSLLDSPALKYATLERLVHERVLAAAAADEHLIATDARLAAELQRDPTIASLRRADGTLDMERYQQLLAAQGLTPAGFEANARHELSSRQVLGGVSETGFSSAARPRSPWGRFRSAAKPACSALPRPSLPTRSSRPTPICRATTRPMRRATRRRKPPAWSTWCWTWRA